MIAYKNRQGHSGVTGFEAGRDFIAVEFIDHQVYLYNYEKPGAKAVEEMKALALKGEGLSTYISRHVSRNFAARVR